MNQILADRFKHLQDSIGQTCARAGRSEKSVRLIIVTKTAPPELVKDVIRLGWAELGESRAQRLTQIAAEINTFLSENADQPDIPKAVHWHMIGHLQRNKVKATLKHCRMIQSVDTLRLAEEINTCAYKMGIHTDILLQVNCSGEPQKYGVPVGATVHLAEQIATMTNLRLTGLMTMAPLTKETDRVRACFARAKEVFEDIRAEKIVGAKFKHLSMGMSQDYPIAIEEGATMLRIGSALFA